MEQQPFFPSTQILTFCRILPLTLYGICIWHLMVDRDPPPTIPLLKRLVGIFNVLLGSHITHVVRHLTSCLARHLQVHLQGCVWSCQHSSLHRSHAPPPNNARSIGWSASLMSCLGSHSTHGAKHLTFTPKGLASLTSCHTKRCFCCAKPSYNSTSRAVCEVASTLSPYRGLFQPPSPLVHCQVYSLNMLGWPGLVPGPILGTQKVQVGSAEKRRGNHSPMTLPNTPSVRSQHTTHHLHS